MPTNKALMEQVNRKINRVLASRSWVGDLNLTPMNPRAVQAFDSLMDYVEMLQKQIKGLEETIRKVR